MDELGPGGVPRQATPSYRFESIRISRIGTFLLFLGALLVVVSFAIVAIEYYQIFYGPPPSFFNVYAFYGASQSTLAGLGLILVGIGWVADQVAIERRIRSSEPPTFRGSGTVAFAVFLVGAFCAAAAQFWYAYLLWAEYAQVEINPWKGTLPTFEAAMAIGILLMAMGWLARHLQALRSIERQPPSLGSPPPGPGGPPQSPGGSVPDKIEW